MQHDPNKQQIIFTQQEWAALGLPAEHSSVSEAGRPSFTLPDSEVHGLIKKIAEAERSVEEGMQGGSPDPMVGDGLLGSRQLWLGLYGGLCAVRNTIEDRSRSGSQQRGFLTQ